MMTIRPATSADLPAILAIYNEAVLNTTATADYEPQTLETRTAWFNQHVAGDYAVLVAEEAGQVIGWSALNPYHARPGYRFTAEISVYVAAEWRGKGVGKRLLPALIEAARKRGLYALIASIDSENAASIRLHTTFGFTEQGRLPRIVTKFGRWLDVVYLLLLLDEPSVLQ